MAAKTPSIILVVDDYSDNRTLLSAWLRAKGFKVVEAEDGKEGVLQANRSHPDLILMDLGDARVGRRRGHATASQDSKRFCARRFLRLPLTAPTM